jgi:PEGA domain
MKPARSVAAVAAYLTILTYGQTGNSIKVPDATAIRLSLMEPLSSATNNVDDPVRFEVTEDVKVGELVAIPKGATAVGHVVDVEPKRRMGRAGKLNFALDHVKAPDGSNIRLRASSNRKGDDKTGTVIVGSVLLSPLFLIMRGKDIEIARGTVINAYVDGDREIARPHLVPAASAEPGPPSSNRATLVLKSSPDGADVTIDGKFAGNTPSTLQVIPGDHQIMVELVGHKVWQRTVSVNEGSSVTLNANLEKK